jgi:hypothetical protein
MALSALVPPTILNEPTATSPMVAQYQIQHTAQYDNNDKYREKYADSY